MIGFPTDNWMRSLTFTPPPTPGIGLLQTNLHPKTKWIDSPQGLPRGGVFKRKIKPCIIQHLLLPIADQRFTHSITEALKSRHFFF